MCTYIQRYADSRKEDVAHKGWQGWPWRSWRSLIWIHTSVVRGWRGTKLKGGALSPILGDCFVWINTASTHTIQDTTFRTHSKILPNMLHFSSIQVYGGIKSYQRLIKEKPKQATNSDAKSVVGSKRKRQEGLSVNMVSGSLISCDSLPQSFGRCDITAHWAPSCPKLWLRIASATLTPELCVFWRIVRLKRIGVKIHFFGGWFFVSSICDRHTS